jgi:hypothetical protein
VATKTLIRCSGLSLVIGGILLFLARVMQVALFGDGGYAIQAESDNLWWTLGLPSVFGTIFLLPGITGLYARQADKAGLFGGVAFMAAFIGIALTAGGNWFFAFGSKVFHDLSPELLEKNLTDPAWGILGPAYVGSVLVGGLGWLVMGLSLWKANVLPRSAVGGALVSMILAMLPIFSTEGISSLFLSFLMTVGFVILGYTLWAEKREEGVVNPIPG